MTTLNVFCFLGAVYYGVRILVTVVMWASPRMEKHIAAEEDLWPPEDAVRKGEHITTLPSGKM